MQIDDLAYTYHTENKNQLLKVFDTTNNPRGFKDDSDGIADPTDDYTYDANGNMTKDDNKGITNIIYNHLNLPVKIQFDNGNKIDYIYNATGIKVEKKITKNNTLANHTTYLQGGFQYVGTSLQMFPHAEGYVSVVEINGVNRYNYVFNYTDHLGNIRLSYSTDPSTKALEILEENNYYPFGLKHANYNMSRKTYYKSGGDLVLEEPCPSCPIDFKYNYKFGAKEWQDELGLNVYDFEARMYMPDIGRTTTYDPLAEKFYDFSPQSFLNNNPLRFTDPTGMQGEDWIKRGNQIFYDSDITTQKQAVEKYGENAQHLSEGSKLYSSTNGKADGEYSYIFHDNGTITNPDGSVVHSKETFETSRGTTIIGTESDGASINLELNAALGGGLGFDLSFVKDSGGNWGMFLNSNLNLGLGVDTGLSINKIESTHGGPFLLEHNSADTYSINGGLKAGLGVGGGYGGTLSSDVSNAGKFNPANFGTSDDNKGFIFYSRSTFWGEMEGGLMYRRTISTQLH